jgi:hypothetical protein
MKKRVGLLILLAGLVFTGWQIVLLWQDSYPLGLDSVPDGFLKAARSGSMNPDPFYRLGSYYLWDIRGRNVDQAVRFSGEAVRRNPLNQEYWLALASALHRRGETEKAVGALAKALAVAPKTYRGHWTAGSILLQAGEPEKALAHYAYVLAHFPERSALVFDVLERFYGGPEPLLDRVIPKTAEAFSRYLSHLYERGNIEGVKKAWGKGPSFGFRPGRAETIRYVDFLISRGDFADAYRAYAAGLLAEGQKAPGGDNLLIDGGFEGGRGLGGGFDWKISAPPGAEVSFSPETRWEGKRALKISFSGKENVDFHHIFQFVAWKPNRTYLLQAKIKTQGLTTKSGICLEVQGVGKPLYAVSEVLTGDHDWRDLQVSFRTPAQSQGGVVRIRRAKTEKLDRFIAGEAWIDAVRLTEGRGN